MIALAKSCSGGGSLLNYIMSDKKDMNCLGVIFVE